MNNPGCNRPGSHSPGIPIVGVDGCPGGWVIATASVVDGIIVELSAEVVSGLETMVTAIRRGDIAVAAIDMPIGLLDDRPRRCDIETRKVLGPRRSSVFPAPVRATLAATDYEQACALSRAACGKALSKQTYNLLDRIRYLDELLDPADADTIVEAHPEAAFARAYGQPLSSKHHKAGRDQRQRLLRRSLQPAFADLTFIARWQDRSTTDRASPNPTPPIVDLLDAVALTMTANHLLNGTARELGGELDPVGKRAVVVY